MLDSPCREYMPHVISSPSNSTLHVDIASSVMPMGLLTTSSVIQMRLWPRYWLDMFGSRGTPLTKRPSSHV